MTVEVPSDSSRTRRIALVVVVAVLGAALAGVAIWATFFRPAPDTPRQTTYRPAQPTDEATSTPGSADATQVPGASSADTTGTRQPAQQPEPASPRRIAFVLGGRIYVANEDGSAAVAVAPAGGAYSVAPDNKTVALVADASGTAGEMGAVSLVDTTSGMMTSLAQGAVYASPVWAADSRWVYVVTADANDRPSVVRYERATGDSKTVAKGGALRVSVEGDRIAFGGVPGDGPVPVRVANTDGSDARAVAGSTGAPAWGWGPGGVLYFVTESEPQGTWKLWRASAPGFKGKAIATLTLSAPAFAVGEVIVSPDGRYVLLSAVGDDAHSRLWVADLAEQRIGMIATRNDAYPLGWDSSGRVLYFEGNTFQGEQSALSSILPDGTSRRIVVTGARP